jgi:uncharacterized repeat protein (TIGR03803 family)
MMFKGNLMTAPLALRTALLALVAAGCIPGAAQTETVLYDFQGGADGSQPAAGVIADKEGNLYGTTTTVGATGFGTVYELSPPATPGGVWTQTTVYSFQGFLAGDDGANPQAPLIMDEEGNLYGTTSQGGNATIDCGLAFGLFECGTVFKLVRPRQPGGAWQETVIYRFGGFDGLGPYAGLTWGPGGRLYGATVSGGTNGYGTVFELIPPDDNPAGPWTEKVLHSFAGGAEGGMSFGGVVLDHAGNLYGTTGSGGALAQGSVFELTRPTVPGGIWTLKTLYSFTGGSDGGQPYNGVVFDAQGNLYGAATYFGTYGGGTIYQLTPPAAAGGAWTENTLYEFTSGPDGGIPFATPIVDRKGNIFGTASQGNGGLFSSCSSFCGTVYELSPPGPGASSWTETTLYSFVGVNGLVFDGAYPVGSLLLGKHGVLYGTTLQGGDFGGDGAVFEVVP